MTTEEIIGYKKNTKNVIMNGNTNIYGITLLELMMLYIFLILTIVFTLLNPIIISLFPKYKGRIAILPFRSDIIQDSA
ncbi:unnamed protein product [marine sediment metagenome]|uniref:Uncharacterized protein n=1 Tax=marine sediment metagenome TaxID=412755 RepID=X1LY04_9ZZZZ